MPLPMMARSILGDDLVDEQPPLLGDPDRGDAAVLHARLRDRAVVVEEGGLADVEGAPDDVVDVGPRVGAYDARGGALLAARRPITTTQLALASSGTS